MEIKINLSDEQIKHLKVLSRDHFPGSDKNLCTDRPLHFVQTKRFNHYPLDYAQDYLMDYTIAVYDNDACKTYSLEDFIDKEIYAHGIEAPENLNLIPYEEAYNNGIDGKAIYDETDYVKYYLNKFGFDCSGLEEEIEIVAEHGEYEDVAFFFTLEEAKRYIKYQAHNLCEPITYSKCCGYSNYGDYKILYDTLRSIGDTLNKEEVE